MNGWGPEQEKAFKLYPAAFREINFHDIKGVKNLEGTLIHELTHALTGTILNQWRKQFGWYDDWEDGRQFPGGWKSHDKLTEGEENCISEYAKSKPDEDICDSMVGALLGLQQLDPQRLVFLNRTLLKDRDRADIGRTEVEVKRYSGNEIVLPRLDSPVLFTRAGRIEIKLGPDKTVNASLAGSAGHTDTNAAAEFWKDKVAAVVAKSEEGFGQARKQLKDRNVSEVIKIIITDEIDLKSLGGIARLKEIIRDEAKGKDVALTIINLDGVNYDLDMLQANAKGIGLVRPADVLRDDADWQRVTEEAISFCA
jgi:hypothetical protein